jgi:hypothetical protein
MPILLTGQHRPRGGPMSRTSNHHDQYYSPTSPVGRVRAERVKYLLGLAERGPVAWDQTEKIDPTTATAVDPTHEIEASQLLLDYYQTVRRDRRIRQVAMLVSFFGIGGVSVLIGSMFNNALVALGGAAAGIIGVYGILAGIITLPGTAGAAKHVLKTSGYFRDLGLLGGYLITTRSAAALWEAAGLEEQRQSIDYEAVRLRSHPYLPDHRQAEITRLDAQEQALRQKIVDMLDPQTPSPSYFPGEMSANFGALISLGRLAPDGVQTMWGSANGEGGVQR